MNKQAVAVVTGASSGIGAAYADGLAKRGYGLLLVARREDKLEALAQKLRREGAHDVTTHVADLANGDGVRSVERILAGREDIDLLVNNAGLGALGPTAQTGTDAAESLVLVNVLALTRLSIAALEKFRKRDRGILINIASVIALGPSPTAAAYSGSKAYVLNFSRSLQQEYANTNVTIQTVLPGPVHSEFFERSGITKPIFPENLYMTPDQLVATALRALDMKETVCFPTLPDVGHWDDFEAARKKFYKAVVASGAPAARYSPEGAI